MKIGLKNKGFSLIETIVYMVILTTIFTIVIRGLNERREKQDFLIQ